jgi:putative ATPase
VTTIGYPEARILLSECAIYLATSPKSNSSYAAIKNAQEAVKMHGDLPVPLELRNAPTRLMKDLGYGREYQYAHDFDNNFVAAEFLPDALSGEVFYSPGKNTREKTIRDFLSGLWKGKYRY